MHRQLSFYSLLILFPTLVALSACSGGGGGGEKGTFYKDADLDGYGDATLAKEFKLSKAETDDNGNMTVTEDDTTLYVTNDDDCNDADATVSPGDSEVAEDGVDNNCDGSVDEGGNSVNEETDDDGDGYAEVAGDCDDSNSAINPAAIEVCDSVDNDCDGLTDADDTSLSGGTTYYPDVDGDTFGDKSSSGKIACSQPDAYVTDNTDCDDSTTLVKPKIVDCSGNTSAGYINVDNDCDGETDEDDCSDLPIGDGSGLDKGNLSKNLRKTDNDGDGYCENDTKCTDESKPGDCDDDNASINPGKVETTLLGNCSDQVDNDCDGKTDDQDDGCQEEAKEAIKWDITPIWRGAGLKWDTECDNSSTYNMEYAAIKSYVTFEKSDKTINNDEGSAKIKASLNTMLDHDNGDYAYKYMGYWTTIAHNKKYLQSYSSTVDFTCSEDNNIYDGVQGKCSKSFEIDLVNDGDMDNSWLQGKKAAIILRGFTVDYDDNGDGKSKNSEMGDNMVRVKLTDDLSNGKVGASVTTNFNGAQGSGTDDYLAYVRYTVFVYDPNFVVADQFGIKASGTDTSNYWNSSVEAYFINTEETLENTVLANTAEDNVFFGYKTWGEDVGKNDTHQFHKVAIYSSVSEWSTDENKGTVTIKSNATAHYRADCGTVGERKEFAEDLEFVFLGCKDDSICQVKHDGVDDWKRVNKGESAEKSFTVEFTGLPTYE